MNARILVTGIVAVLSLAFGICRAQEKVAEQQQSPEKIASDLRREWIIRQAPRLITDQAKLKTFIAGVDGLDEFEVNELANHMLEAFEQRRKQQFAALRAANARERALQAEREQQLAEQLQQQQQAIPNFFPPPPPVIGFVREPYGYYPYPYPPIYVPPPVIGYFPVVTWLPSGVSLSANAIVSPDRRRVRMSLMPFLSSIGPVDTFNYSTGETRRLPQYESPGENAPSSRPVNRGLRTRSDSRNR